MNSNTLTGAAWRKSRRSNGQYNCVEVAKPSGVVAVRDSKDPDGGALTFGPAEWRRFADQVKDGQHDL